MFGRGASLRSAIYVCCLAAFLFFGYDQGVFGGLLENKDWLRQFNHPRDVIVGITVSSYCLGALFGCILNFAIGDILGRRKMIWLAMALIIVGASLQTSAYSLPHLIVGRVITGLGTGAFASPPFSFSTSLSGLPLSRTPPFDPPTPPLPFLLLIPRLQVSILLRFRCTNPSSARRETEDRSFLGRSGLLEWASLWHTGL